MKIIKSLILGTAGASVLAAAPAAASPFGRNDDRGRIERVQTGRVVVRDDGRRDIRVRQVETRRWKRGERFDRRYARNYRVIVNPRLYRVHDAPRGYRWVQSGNDAVLVAIATGLIGAILGNAL